jgi:hypothetical protein
MRQLAVYHIKHADHTREAIRVHHLSMHAISCLCSSCGHGYDKQCSNPWAYAWTMHTRNCIHHKTGCPTQIGARAWLAQPGSKVIDGAAGAEQHDCCLEARNMKHTSKGGQPLVLGGASSQHSNATCSWPQYCLATFTTFTC